jgi:acyl-CoA synthetase (AMP-forming)/AMP-acid ligase II
VTRSAAGRCPSASPGICARGYQTMPGYFDMPERTAETVDPGGWLHTGDLGTMDDRGYVRITGSAQGHDHPGWGENIYATEIEQVLFTHPGTSDVTVLGLPDPIWGEIVAAVFVRDGDAASDGLVLLQFVHKGHRVVLGADEAAAVGGGEHPVAAEPEAAGTFAGRDVVGGGDVVSGGVFGHLGGH